MPMVPLGPNDDDAVPPGDGSSLIASAMQQHAVAQTQQAPGPSIPAASIGPAVTSNQPSFWDTVLPTVANLFTAKMQDKQAQAAVGQAATAAQITKNAADAAQKKLLAASGGASDVNAPLLICFGITAVAILYFITRKPRT